jgi:hypothetical protein
VGSPYGSSAPRGPSGMSSGNYFPGARRNASGAVWHLPPPSGLIFFKHAMRLAYHLWYPYHGLMASTPLVS